MADLPEARIALERWRPSTNWARPIDAAVTALFADLTDAPSWATLAMMLGDTGAPALCFLVCEYARSLACEPSVRARLGSHQALAAMDLGLGGADAAGVVRPDRVRLAPWLAHQRSPFDGSAERAAVFCLCLAAWRTGLVEGPASPTLDDLCELSRWRLVPMRS